MTFCNKTNVAWDRMVEFSAICVWINCIALSLYSSNSCTNHLMLKYWSRPYDHVFKCRRWISEESQRMNLVMSIECLIDFLERAPFWESTPVYGHFAVNLWDICSICSIKWGTLLSRQPILHAYCSPIIGALSRGVLLYFTFWETVFSWEIIVA